MEHNVNKAYILTSQELTLVAAGKGISDFFSVGETAQLMDEETVCKVMSNLYQRGVLNNDGEDSFCLEEELCVMMEVIADAQRMVLIRNLATTEDSKILYLGKIPVMMEKSQADKDGIRVYQIDNLELRSLIETGISQDIGERKQVLNEEELVQDLLKTPTVLQDEKAEYLGNGIMVIEGLRKCTEKVEWRMILKQGKDERQLLYYEQENHDLIHVKEPKVDVVMERIWEDSYDIG